MRGADWADFDWVLADRLVGGGSRAASVAVAVDGKVVHFTAYGERVPGEPVERTDRFRIASISKPIAAAAALRLVDKGELRLDKPVLQMVADRLGVTVTDPRLQLVTLRQLLGHSSGLGLFEHEMFYAGAGSCPEAAATALSARLLNDPGTNYRYSNMNYCLIGLLIEAVRDEPFSDVLRAEVLAPVGVKHMRVAGTRDVRANDVLHDVAPGRIYMETLGAAGSWIATSRDVVKFADSLDRARPGRHRVSARLLAQMRRPSTPPRPGEAPRQVWYGLGLMNWSDGSYGHTGTLENTHAMFVVRPDGVTWAVLVSGENPWTTGELRAMVDEAMLAAMAR